MSPQLGYWEHGHPDVKDNDLVLVHHDCGQVVRVLLVPCNAEQRALVLALIDDGRVL